MATGRQRLSGALTRREQFLAVSGGGYKRHWPEGGPDLSLSPTRSRGRTPRNTLPATERARRASSDLRAPPSQLLTHLHPGRGLIDSNIAHHQAPASPHSFFCLLSDNFLV
jgi:hypothetical protein